MDITDFARIETHCEDTPVYGFGSTFVHGVSPTFLDGVVLQDGNENPVKKIQPKKSWELKENRMGSTSTREPRTVANDDQALLPLHLIDGDPETAWCSHGQVTANVEPQWIRIDLPLEQLISAISIVPHAKGKPEDDRFSHIGQWNQMPGRFGQAVPRHLAIKVSVDGEHWDTVFEGNPREPLTFDFDARLVKMIWITGRDLPLLSVVGHAFSISGVEVRDVQGENRALLSRGAGVQVSSTFHGFSLDRWTHEMLWPIQYDIGFKWVRVGYDLGMFTWKYVEQEKGVYKVDERADACITECVEAGMNVLMVLDKGNWRHADPNRKIDRVRDVMENYFDSPPQLHSNQHVLLKDGNVENYIQGYLDYVRFMVRHFKDRVTHFEVWNEWNPPTEDSTREYCEVLKRAAAIIREEAPDAKVVMTGIGWAATYLPCLLAAMDEVAELVDVISWHPWYGHDPNDPIFLAYPNWLKRLREEAEKRGFKGELMATEWSWSDPYPMVPSKPAGGLDPNRPYWKVSELQAAKNAARLNLTHLAHGVYSFWNETYCQHCAQWATGLLRFPTFSADSITPMQPKILYYVMRTLCTVMDDTEPDDALQVEFSPTPYNLEWYGMRRRSGERLLLMWLKGHPTDSLHNEAVVDVVLKGVGAEQGRVIDTLNGTTQELSMCRDSGALVVRGVHVKDWPVIVGLC